MASTIHIQQSSLGSALPHFTLNLKLKMPTTRRKAATNSRASQQATLSFNNKSSSRVTKAGANSPQLDSKDALLSNTKKTSPKSKLNEPAKVQIEEEINRQPEEPQTAEINLTTPEKEKAKVQAASKSTTGAAEEEGAEVQTPSRKSKRSRKIASTSNPTKKAEQDASKISDAQINKYWNAEEDSRLAPRSRFYNSSKHFL